MKVKVTDAFSLTDTLPNKITKAAKKYGYKNKSELVEEAVNEKLVKLEKKKLNGTNR